MLKSKRKKTGEAELFQEVWDEREHVCINCKLELGDEMRTFYFSHIKGKGSHPELRLLKENIQILCFECHTAYDQQGRDKYNARKDINRGKDVYQINYRKYYFGACEAIADALFEMSGEVYHKKDIHAWNKNVAKVTTTKGFTPEQWVVYLDTVSAYWEKTINVNIS